METSPKNKGSQQQSQQSTPSSQHNKTTTRGGGGAPAGGEFIVAKILGKRIMKYEAQYHVKWEGYSMAEATWEPFSNLQYNVVRTRFDDRLRNWVKKHDEAGTGHRVSDTDREIAEWTSKQAAGKLKFAKNNEELRAERVDHEWREFNSASKTQQQRQQTAHNPPATAETAEYTTANAKNVADASFSTPGKPAATTTTTASTNGSAPTPTPTGLVTPGGGGGGGGPVTGTTSGKGSSLRRKRTSPYPEWVAVARKRLLTEKRNVLKIYSLSSINDVPCYKVQLDGLREPEYIPTVLVKSHHPSRVIEFYEDHLTVPSPSKNGKRIKLKDLFAEMQQQQQLQQQQQQQQAGSQQPFPLSSSTTTNQSTNNELAEDAAAGSQQNDAVSNKSSGSGSIHIGGGGSSTPATATGAKSSADAMQTD